MEKKLKSKRHKSALKRARQNIKRYGRNKLYKSALKTAVKKVIIAAHEGKKDDASKALSEAIPIIDKAVSKGIIHRNTGSRKISRLSRIINSLSVQTTPA